MTDRNVSLSALDRLESPDLWSDVVGREPRPPVPDVSPRRRVLIIVVALGLALAGLFFVGRAFRASERDIPGGGAPPSVFIFSAGKVLDGRPQVYSVDLRDGSLIQLTSDRSHKGYVAWSPDRRSIAFVSSSGKGSEETLWRMRSDGTDREEICTGCTETFFDLSREEDGSTWLCDGCYWQRMSWSPDGRWLVAVGDQPNVIDLGAPSRSVSLPHQAMPASWAPDGSRLVSTFSSGMTGRTRLVFLDPTSAEHPLVGEGVQHVVPGSLIDDGYPQWSPDGSLIAFVHDDEESSWDGSGRLFVMRPDGTDRREIARIGPHRSWFSWSPDGGSIAFMQDGQIVPTDGPALTIVDVDTGSTRPVISCAEPAGPCPFGRPIWTSDGAGLVFAASLEVPKGRDVLPLPSGIFTVRLDGSGLRRLSGDLAYAFPPE